MTTVWQDTGRTIPGDWGEPVAVVDDSAAGIAGKVARPTVQANAALRWKLGRAPVDRRNLSPLSEPTHMQLANGTGTSDAAVGLAGFDGTIQFPGGTVGNRIAYRDHGVLAATEYTLSCFMRMDDDAPPVPGTDFTLVIGNAGGDYKAPVDLGGGLWRVARTATSTTNVVNTGVLKTDANSTRGFRVTGFQIEAGSAVTPYQRVRSVFDITEAGVPSYPYLRGDLVDDVLPVAFPDGGTFDVALFGRLGCWVERDVTIAPAGTLNIGPTTVTDGPAGLLAAVGDLVGYVVLDRTISSAELNLLLQYHQARGAGDLLESI